MKKMLKDLASKKRKFKLCKSFEKLALHTHAQIESEFDCKLKSTTISSINIANKGTSEKLLIQSLTFQVITKLL